MLRRQTLLALGAGGLAGYLFGRLKRAREGGGLARPAPPANDVEQRRLRGVLDALPVAVFVTSADGRMLETNPAVSDIWDVDVPPLLEGPVDYGRYKGFWPDTGERLESYEWGTARVLATGEPVVGEELDIETFAGRRKTILHYALPIRDEKGRVAEAVAVNVDVTDRKRTEQERERLLERERQARSDAERRAREETALREAVGAITQTFTTRGVVQQIAARAVDAVGADRAFVTRIEIESNEVEIAAVAAMDEAPLGHRRPYPTSMTARVVERKEPQVLRLAVDPARPGPEELARFCPGCSVAIVPLINSGQPIGALFLFRDPEKHEFRSDEITRAYTFGDLAALAFQKVHMFEESERRREEIERVTESRARLMRGFSHDVKNPLGAADGHAQLVEDEMVGTLTDEQKKSLGRIRRSIQSAVGLIEDLVELARAEAGQIQIETVPTDVREAAREIGEEYQPQAEAAGLTLRLDVPDEFPVIESDASRVRQILGNLLSNALKYTEKGGVALRVDIRSDPAAPDPGGWVAVEVSDTGPGISVRDQKHLFEEFRRIAAAKRGAGLGLAISRRIARALGGDLTVQSEVGSGSTFTLLLPVKELGQERRARAAD